MVARLWSLVAATLVVAACNGSPAGPGEPRIDFSIGAPTEVASKAVIDVEARVTEANQVELPLVVVFEKANVDEPFFEVGRFFLAGNERVAVARIPVFMDPRIRVTVHESGARDLSVSKTVQVDVLDFP